MCQILAAGHLAISDKILRGFIYPNVTKEPEYRVKIGRIDFEWKDRIV